MDSKTWIEKNEKYVMNTYGRFDVVLESGKGCIAKDVNGKEYIDVSSGVGVNALGYCDTDYVEKVVEQLKKLQHTSNYYYNKPSTELAEKLISLSDMSKVFFGNSGAEANECAIKLARKYSFDKYGKGRDEIVSLKNSFHGRTITTLSATGQDVFHNYFFPFTPNFNYGNPNDISDMKKVITENTCGVMVECIQGEGGVNILQKEFLQELEKYCNDKDIVFIIDEVQTGIGRTGTLFAFEQFGLKPDVVTLAKGLGGGLPIGVCMCNQKLDKVMGLGVHGSTFGGNPVVCAGALCVLEKVAKKEFLDEVKEKGGYFADKIREIPGVSSVKNMGLMIGIELEADNAKEIAKKCVSNGLFIITAKNLLRMLPPLVITKDEMDKAVEILKNSILN